jgi:glycerol-3-phosphate dehydrogenase (NAD(P)+)
MDIKRERIAVLGAGSWGTTLAALLADKGHDVALWEFDPKAAQALHTTRRLSVLPDLKVPASIQITSALHEVLKDRPVVVSATPSQFVRSTMSAAAGGVSRDAVVISVSKGLEEKSHKRMSEIIREELKIPEPRVAVFSGPSHAEEVCRHLPTAMVAASSDPALTARVQTLFTQDYFRVVDVSKLDIQAMEG